MRGGGGGDCARARAFARLPSRLSSASLVHTRSQQNATPPSASAFSLPASLAPLRFLPSTPRSSAQPPTSGAATAPTASTGFIMAAGARSLLFERADSRIHSRAH